MIHSAKSSSFPASSAFFPRAKFAQTGHPRPHLLLLVLQSYSSIIKPPSRFPTHAKLVVLKDFSKNTSASALLIFTPPALFSLVLICPPFYLLAKVRQAAGDQR